MKRFIVILGVGAMSLSAILLRYSTAPSVVMVFYRMVLSVLLLLPSVLLKNRQELKARSRDCDLLICGSDQIWNPTLTFGLAKPYFLRFAGPNSRRVSYAASVGPSIRDKGKMLAYVRDLGLPHCVVLTKADKLSKAQRGRSIPVICRTLVVQPWEILTYSSEDLTGRDALLAKIEEVLAEPAEEPVLPEEDIAEDGE